MKKTYELLFIIPAKYTEDELTPIKDMVKDLISQNEGVIKKEEDLGKRKLAYPIKQIFHGYYVMYHFDMETKFIDKMNQTLRHTQEILRHIIVIPTPENEQKVREKRPETKEEHKETSLSETKETDKKIEEDVKPKKKKEAKEKTEVKEKSTSKRKKITLEDLDKSLDEILKDDMI